MAAGKKDRDWARKGTVIGIAQLHHISAMGALWVDTMPVRLVRTEVRRRHVGAKSAPESSLNKGVQSQG